MLRLFLFLRSRSSYLLLAIGAGALGGVASAALMAIINRTLAAHDANRFALGVAFIVTTALVLLASLASRLLLLRISADAMLEMRYSLCAQIVRSPLWKIEQHGSGALMAALTEDILTVSDTLAQFPLLCIHLAIVCACLAYLASLSAPLTAALILLLGLGVAVHELIARRTRPHLAKGRDEWDGLIALYQGLIFGNKELKLHRQRRVEFLGERIRPKARSMRDVSLAWHRLFAIAASYGQGFYFIVIGLMLFVAPSFSSVTPAVLVAFTLLTLYMSGPISAIVAALPSFQRAAVSLQKLQSLGLSLTTTHSEAVPDRGAAPAFHEIEMRGISYAYRSVADERPFVIGPLDVRFTPGELVFITGGNGSGKSSFARVLAGLYPPTSGEMLLNDRPITDLTRDDYRQNFSVIFADFFLFDSLLGVPSGEILSKARAYLERLHLEKKLTLEGKRFSTVNLSQGQRKRLALLSAFLEDRPVYLFDEWAADQDPLYKEVFYRQILPELKAKGKAVIVISHDDQYYDVADRIIRFEEGRIISDSVPARLPKADRSTVQEAVAP